MIITAVNAERDAKVNSRKYKIPTANLLESLFACDRIYDSRGYEIIEYLHEIAEKDETSDPNVTLLSTFFANKRIDEVVVDVQDQVIAAEAHQVVTAYFMAKALEEHSFTHWENVIKKLLTTSDTHIEISGRSLGMLVTFPRIYKLHKSDHKDIVSLNPTHSFLRDTNFNTAKDLTFKGFVTIPRVKKWANRIMGKFVDKGNRLVYADLGERTTAIERYCNILFKVDDQYNLAGKGYVKETFFNSTYAVIYDAALLEVNP
jgi:hypothetical protein